MFTSKGLPSPEYKDCVYQMSLKLLQDPNYTPRKNDIKAGLRYETEPMAGRWCVPTAEALKDSAIAEFKK